MIYINNIEVKPTIFPDKTSQVWKIDECDSYIIDWVWSGNESEVFHLAQLLALIGDKTESLIIPYLPYARQDKEVANTSTFSKMVLIDIIRLYYSGDIITIDEHSTEYATSYSVVPTSMIKDASVLSGADIILYPDAGAYKRYHSYLKPYFNNIIVLDKVRDQLTGNITGLQIDNNLSTLPLLRYQDECKVLIVDDIVDGGMTYIKAVEFLKNNMKKCEVSLYTTHGIYSKGVDVLYDVGIKNIYTTSSLSLLRDNPKDVIILEDSSLLT